MAKRKLTLTPPEEPVMEQIEPVDNPNPLPPADPPLPAGVTKSKPKTNGPQDNGDDSEPVKETVPDEADLPASHRTNAIAIARSRLWDKARQLGSKQIEGGRSLMGLAEICVDGGRDKLLDASRPQDSEKMYSCFRNPNQDLKKPRYQDPDVDIASSYKSNVAKLNWYITLGQMFEDDGVAFFHLCHDVYKGMIADAEKRKSLKYTAAYEAVLSVIRPYCMTAQAAIAKREIYPVMPDAEAIHDLMLKADREEKTAWDLLAEAYVSLDKANEGRAADAKKGLGERLGLKDDRINGPGGILETIRDIAAGEGGEVEKKFLAATQPKPKKPKKSKGAAQSEPNGDDDNGEGDDETGNDEAAAALADWPENPA